jgi:hypothetical protein
MNNSSGEINEKSKETKKKLKYELKDQKDQDLASVDRLYIDQVDQPSEIH